MTFKKEWSKPEMNSISCFCKSASPAGEEIKMAADKSQSKQSVPIRTSNTSTFL